MSPYKSWAEQNGISQENILIYDVDKDGNGVKVNTANVIIGDLQSDANYVFVGHSAGADTAILVANYMIDQGNANQVSGVILLDPTLSASPDYPNVGDMAEEMFDIPQADVLLFVGNNTENYEDEGLPSILGSYSHSKYQYRPYSPNQLSNSSDVHMAMAVDQTVFNNATSFVTLPTLR